jgi:hypothetical protein
MHFIGRKWGDFGSEILCFCDADWSFTYCSEIFGNFRKF